MKTWAVSSLRKKTHKRCGTNLYRLFLVKPRERRLSVDRLSVAPPSDAVSNGERVARLKQMGVVRTTGKPSRSVGFRGWAVISARAARSVECEVEATPILGDPEESNPHHADIVLPGRVETDACGLALGDAFRSKGGADVDPEFPVPIPAGFVGVIAENDAAAGRQVGDQGRARSRPRLPAPGTSRRPQRRCRAQRYSRSSPPRQGRYRGVPAAAVASVQGRVSSPDRGSPEPSTAPICLDARRPRRLPYRREGVESPTPSLPTMTVSGLVSVAPSPDIGPHPAGKIDRRGGLDAEGRSGHRSPPKSPLATLRPAPTCDPRPAVSTSFLEASHALSVPSRRGATPHGDLAFFRSPGHPRIRRVLRNAPWKCFPARGIGQHRRLTAAPPVSCLTNATHTPDNRPNAHYCGSARPRS